jgi:hypothetical protein
LDAENFKEHDYQLEIDEFLIIDPTHAHHFKDGKPSIEEWKEIRHHYASDNKEIVEPVEDPKYVVDENGMHLYHSLSISIFVRNPYDLSDS